MKKLGKLKLNQLSKADLKKKELNHIKGGCLCSCAYAGGQCSQHDSYWGGSSNIDNCDANWH